MGFELKYYTCPRCQAPKLAKNLDTGAYVCDNTEGGCTHRVKREDAESSPPSDPSRAKSRDPAGSVDEKQMRLAIMDIYSISRNWSVHGNQAEARCASELMSILSKYRLV